MNTDRNSRIEILAYKIWEEQGRPEGRQEENWAEAERRLRFESDGSSKADDPSASDDPVAASRLPGTLSLSGETPDTPAHVNPTSSRQQAHPSQSTQTTSREIDSKAGSTRRTRPR